MKVLKQQCKDKQFMPCYLFFGTETYLKKAYAQYLQKAMIPEGAEIMNVDIFEGKQCSIGKIMDSGETVPFLCDKRLLVVKDSGLFQAGRKEDTERLHIYLKTLPETTCILFMEEEVDKRGKLYKTVAKLGHVIEWNPLSERELIQWIEKKCKKNQFQVENSTAAYLIRTVGGDMTQLAEELEKLFAFLQEKREITKQDIDTLCTKSLETRIFDLVDAVSLGKPKEAITIYRNLLLLKESPLMVLAMLIRQFRMILQCKVLLEAGETQSQIGKTIGLRDFVVRNCIQQGKGFSVGELQKALELCLETDVAIKTGKMGGDLAVETVLMTYSMGK